MAKIQGITIEIGGDATGLDRALKEVNSAAVETRRELKEVNKALKLDPGNAELLAQKQRVLTEAVENTTEKLRVLKKVQDEAKAQLAGGNISQTQYDAIAREVSNTTQQLKKAKQEVQDFGSVSAQQFVVAGRSISQFGDKLTNIGQKLSMVSTIAAGMTVAMVKYASDTEESMNKVESVFGSSADYVKSFADSSIESMGAAKGSALDMAALFGDMATSMGLNERAAAKMSVSLVQLAGDLASFKNISLDTATNALKGIFTGETESLKNLGVVMNQTSLDSYAMANGFGKTTSQMTEAEKVQLRYAYVLNATSNAQGDFEKTSSGTANSLRTLQESLKEMAASLGEVIAPAITKVVQAATQLFNFISKLPTPIKAVISVLIVITALLAPVLIAVGSIASGIGSLIPLLAKLPAVIEAVNVALLGMETGFAAAVAAEAPFILAAAAIVAAVAAVGFGIYELVTHWDEVTAATQRATKSMQDAVANTNIGQLLSNQIDSMRDFATTGLDSIVEAFRASSGFVSSVWSAGLETVHQVTRTIVRNVTGLTEEQMNELEGHLANIWDKITANISNAWNNIINGTRQRAKAFVEGIVDTIRELPNKVRRALEDMKNALVEKISAPFENIIKKAQTWGKDLIDNFIGGLTGNSGSLESSIQGIAQIIDDNIGFSEPKEGPLSDFHKNAPDMIDLWVQGIKENMYKVTNATTKLASSMNPASVSASQTASASTSSVTNTSTLNVYVDHISELSDLIRIQNQAQQMNRMGARA